MPVKLKTFDFPTNSGGERSKYDWESLLDGGTYKMVAGEDYTCRTPSFKLMAEITCMKRNKNLKIATVDKGEAVVLQATDMNEEEIEANKERLFEYNEKLKIGRAKKAETNGAHTETEIEEIEQETEEPELVPAKPAKGKGRK